MRLPSWLAVHLAALRALLAFTVLLGLAYPLLLVGVARLPGLSARADGSLLTVDGRPVGSRLLGQSFTDADVSASASGRAAMAPRLAPWWSVTPVRSP